MDIHLLNNSVKKYLSSSTLTTLNGGLTCLYIIYYDRFPFFAVSLVKPFCIPHPNFSINPRAEGCACSAGWVLSHFQGAFLDTSLCWAWCNVCLLPLTPPRLLCPLALWKAASATWHLCRLSDLDVAEQVDNQGKKNPWRAYLLCQNKYREENTGKSH